MKKSIEVDNIKCGGCANRISQKLASVDGLSDIEINIDEGIISFQEKDGFSMDVLLNKLKSMGYPPKGESKFIDSAKSYVSCMIGRLDPK